MLILGGTGWSGSLQDRTPDTAEEVCTASRDGWVCTRETHGTRSPHLAGNGREILAIWWDGE